MLRTVSAEIPLRSSSFSSDVRTSSPSTRKSNGLGASDVGSVQAWDGRGDVGARLLGAWRRGGDLGEEEEIILCDEG